jgi:acetyl-CoA carboxylase, biotin carboxylase subunit
LFRKILIANRGEIALRIIRTCKKLRVKTVAVYSDSDAELKHVVEADQAYNIGPGEPSQSYLNIPRIVGVARESGAEGLHPGYGFLAENSELARDCEESGIVFIGPPSRILGHVTNKVESKKVVSDAGIPAIPGSEKELRTSENAEAEARKIGFPVLVKAVFGGGGRGMRIARTLGELRSALERAGAEAKTGFGHSDLYLEKYLERPRHIEVQVIAGRRGRMIHLGERECSLQRRYQKILEETPSAVVDDADRKRLVGLALKVAQVTHYENAGTMEFIRSKNGKFYYMETNKRIQVEHLITEMVTGVDIVEEQLRIASGDGLNLSQNEIEFSGAAINCRINAEDPSKGFVPTPGRVTRFVPPGGPGVRVDTALFNGCPVPEYYDSLIAKIACLARTRDDAIRRISTALGEIVVEGVQTTIPVHQMLLRNRLFEQGDYHTQLLDKLLTQWRAPEVIAPEEAAGLYVALNHQIAISANNAKRLSPQNKWRTPLQNFDGPKPALFVEV